MPNVIVAGKDGYTVGATFIGVTLDGLWFAGNAGLNGKIQSTQPGDNSIIQNCVFINMPEAISIGSDNVTIQNCVFINCGWGTLQHSVYYSNSSATAQLLKDNIFIGGQAYHIQLWHDPANVSIQGNFSASAVNNLVIQGNGHEAFNNFLWSSVSTTLFFSTGSYTFHDNYLGQDVFDANPAEGIASNNHFYNAASYRFGANPTNPTWDDFTTKTGYTKAQIDAAVAALDAAKNLTTAQLVSDTTIATNAALIWDMMAKQVA